MSNNLYSPFPFHSHKWRVMSMTKAKDKGLIAFYIDARDVMERLDQCVGNPHWHDEYTVLAMNSGWVVECKLTVKSVTKSDVGEGDDAKSAFSDSLKRTAVKFGVGRYLYDMDTGQGAARWFPLDDFKKPTDDANKRIEQLLRRQLQKLGADMTGPQSLDEVQEINPSDNGKPSKAFIEFQKSIRALFPNDEDDARHWLVKCYTSKATPKNIRESSKDLTDGELADQSGADSARRGVPEAV